MAASDMRRGDSKSCGCLIVEFNKARTIHGHASGGSPSPEYVSWRAMIMRCYIKNVRGYKDYGGRGIKVCKKWRDNFAAFLEDLGKRPAGMTLDRINNSGDYTPKNCRWATPQQQALNRRNTIMVTINDETVPLVFAIRKYSANERRVRQRLVAGWTVTDALITPPRQNRQKRRKYPFPKRSKQRSVTT